MFSICSTKKGDVKNCVKEMKKQGYAFPLYQLSLKEYKRLEANQAEVPGVVQKKFPRHSITIKNGTLHRKMCNKTDVSKSIFAHITRPSLTGLKMCNCIK